MMAEQVRHNPFPISCHIPLDTDAIHPQALIAAFTIGVERLEYESEKRNHAVDWSTVTFKLEPVTTEENLTRMRISALRLM
jgi:hypothetical protein